MLWSLPCSHTSKMGVDGQRLRAYGSEDPHDMLLGLNRAKIEAPCVQLCERY